MEVANENEARPSMEPTRTPAKKKRCDNEDLDNSLPSENPEITGTFQACNDLLGIEPSADSTEANYILRDLKSGEKLLWLQEVPQTKASHCRSWDCMPQRVTGKPKIQSDYRLALTGGDCLPYPCMTPVWFIISNHPAYCSLPLSQGAC